MRTLLLSFLALACTSAPAPKAETPHVEVPRAEPAATASVSEAPPVSERVVERGSCGHECKGSAGDALAAALRERAGRARKCYEQELKRNPETQGRLLITLTVAEDGAPCETKITSSTMNVSGEFETCLVRLMDTRYPAPAGGCIQVVLPLAFVPAPAPAP
jgi:hypothetical protein